MLKAVVLSSCLGFVAALSCAAHGSQPTSAGRQKPNIILFLADDIGAECFGSYGGESYQTPRLDALAKEGVRFTHCYAQPLCTPTRVQLMTGQSNARNYTAFGILDPRQPTFGPMLQRGGYATAVAGKWQLYGAELEGLHARAGAHPRSAGFDEYRLWQVSQRGSRYWDPLIEHDGEEARELAGRYGPDLFADFVCDFITRHRERPFFVYYPMVLTHSPFTPTPDDVASGESPQGNQARGKRDTDHFASMVAYMDKIVGRVVDHVESLGLRDNTVVIFTTDNGTDRAITSRANGRTVRGGKGLTTDAGTHVPLIVSWPAGVKGGSVCHDLVDSTDFLPTLAELSGATIPPGPLDGRSFLPQIRGEPGRPRQHLVAHYHPRPERRDSAPQRWARDHRWKLYDTGGFYDLPSDPLEESPLDLANAPPEARAAHEKLLAALRAAPVRR